MPFSGWLPAATERLGIGIVTSVGNRLDILTQVDSAIQRTLANSRA